MTVSTFEEITCTKPERSLVEDQRHTAGRNAQGRITVRHHGGGNKRKYRIIDFKRKLHYVFYVAIDASLDVWTFVA